MYPHRHCNEYRPYPRCDNGKSRMGRHGTKLLEISACPRFSSCLILVCVGIYAVLIQTIAATDDISGAIWTCMGYTVSCALPCLRRKPCKERLFRALRGRNSKNIKSFTPIPLGDTREARYRAQRKHYPTMSIEELCALPVKEIADNDSILFLWATFPQLKEALQLIKARALPINPLPLYG